MKKVLLSAILGLAAVTLTPALSHAGTFGLITGCGCCCSKCQFCVRPYNAFTPVCCGNITCMGCMPFTPMPNYSGLGYPAPDYSPAPAADDGCCAPGTATTTPSHTQSPTTLPPLPGSQQFTQPPPLPIPMPQFPASTNAPPMSMAPNPYGAIQAGYHPAVAPTYNPYLYYNYYAPMGQTPYYWNAK